jgi:hypothetical protein
MNVYVLEIESGKDSAYVSRRLVTRILSIINMTGTSKIKVGEDFMELLKSNSNFLEEKGEKSDCIGYLGNNPVYLSPEIAGFLKIGEKDLKIIFE